jgi:hypothetical protein
MTGKRGAAALAGQARTLAAQINADTSRAINDIIARERCDQQAVVCRAIRFYNTVAPATRAGKPITVKVDQLDGTTTWVEIRPITAED